MLSIRPQKILLIAAVLPLAMVIASCGAGPACPSPASLMDSYCAKLQPYLDKAVKGAGFSMSLNCLSVPGLVELGSIGVTSAPMDKRLDYCVTPEEETAMESKQPRFNFGYEASGRQDISGSGELDFSSFVPWIPKFKVEASVKDSADFRMYFENVHFESLSRVADTLAQSAAPGARSCIEYLCKPDAVFTSRVLVGRVKVEVKTHSSKLALLDVKAGNPLRLQARGEQENGTTEVFEGEKDIAIAIVEESGRAMLLRSDNTYCNGVPRWSCITPKGEIGADCEQGGLDGKNATKGGRRTFSGWGDMREETFCRHDAPNQGHAHLYSSCDQHGAEVTIRLNVDGSAKGGFTDSHDCPQQRTSKPEGTDKCWTDVGVTLRDGGATAYIPPEAVGRYDLVVVDANKCAGSSLLRLIGPSGAIDIRTAALYPISESGMLRLQLEGSLRDVQDGTTPNPFSQACEVTLRLQPHK